MIKHNNPFLKTVHKTHFRHRNHRECRDFDTREQSTSHKVGSDARRVIVFDICQNLKANYSLIEISKFTEAGVSLMVEHAVACRNHTEASHTYRTVTTPRAL